MARRKKTNNDTLSNIDLKTAKLMREINSDMADMEVLLVAMVEKYRDLSHKIQTANVELDKMFDNLYTVKEGKE